MFLFYLSYGHLPQKMNKIKKFTKPRVRKKSRYKTGIHVSAKSNLPIKYRSGWEMFVCLYFDQEPSIIKYYYEQIKIPYVANIKTGKVRTYYPDFLVIYSDGTKKLIEVKRQNLLDNIKVQKKAEAAKTWCEKNQIIYEFLTDAKVKEIQKMFKHLMPVAKKKKKKTTTAKKTLLAPTTTTTAADLKKK